MDLLRTKKWIAGFAVMCLLLPYSLTLSAQSTTLEQFDEKRLDITRKGMYTLGSWAVLNMAVSGVALTNSDGSAARFHEMNLYWNVVNAGLAGASLLGMRKYESPTSPYGILQEQYKIEKLLLVNAGLDVAYIAGGLYMRERAKNSETRADMWKGFGESVMLQGAFLLVFDVVLHQIHVSHRKKSRPLWDRLELSASLGSLRLRF